MYEPKFNAKIIIPSIPGKQKSKILTFGTMKECQRIGILICFLALIGPLGCGERKGPAPNGPALGESKVVHARGFTIHKEGALTILEVKAPWPGATKSFKYLLAPKEILATMRIAAGTYDAIVGTPVEKVVLTSTTHIPALEALGALETLVGFPDLDLISSPAARELVDRGQVMDLGRNEGINTEIVLSLDPQLVMGFGINDTNRAYETLQRSGIPVVYNGDWVEHSPLGKAEWIKFFAPFFQKEAEGDRIFAELETAYREAKKLAKQAKDRPTVLTGGLYKDVWHVAGGESWFAQFIQDAHGKYLWADSPGTGGIPLGLEAVLVKAKDADIWLNPSHHTSYRSLAQANPHHGQFKAFVEGKVYSNAIEKGEKGGVLFYELAPQRPDLVLRDLIHILHPELLPDHRLLFIKPLD